MKLRFWGVRGAFAMSGRDYLRYGGNTCSIELMSAAGRRMLVDLGTGATEYARHLMTTEFATGQGVLPIVLTHTHLDHIQGLPFFTPFFIKGNQIRIMGVDPAAAAAPAGRPSVLSLEGTLQNQLDPHYSPLNGLENLAAGVTIESFVAGAAFALGDFAITTAAVPHGSMWTTALRVECDGKVVALLTDVEYPSPDAPLPEAIAIARGADLLVHDAMLADADYHLRRGWGHSPGRAGVAVAEAAGAKRLALYHHSPDATDDMIDREVAQLAATTKVPVFGAAEGAYLDV